MRIAPIAAHAATRPDAREPSASRPRRRQEAGHLMLVYLVYSAVRNAFGSATGGAAHAARAFGHAETMIAVERALGLYFEPALQPWVLRLPAHGLIRVWNVYYGLGHFVVTGAVLVALYGERACYRVWRNTLLVTTVLALVGSASYACRRDCSTPAACSAAAG